MRHLRLLLVLVFGLMFVMSCNEDEVEEYIIEMQNQYSTLEEFRNALIAIDELAFDNEVFAFLDTLPDGTPDPEGEVVPLSDIINAILAKIEMDDVEGAVYDVYHFDGTSFSLISYLMKAQMAGLITKELMMKMLSYIPLPPIAVANFQPPVQPVVKASDKCECNPKIKIRVTYVYKPACGNYADTISGYAANNTLNNMRTGTWFTLNAEVHGCDCPGAWGNTITPIGLSSHASSTDGGNQVGLISYSSGTFKVTFKFICDCGEEAEATFTLSF